MTELVIHVAEELRAGDLEQLRAICTLGEVARALSCQGSAALIEAGPLFRQVSRNDKLVGKQALHPSW